MKFPLVVIVSLILVACGGGGGSSSDNNLDAVANNPVDTPQGDLDDNDPIDVELRALIDAQGLLGDAAFNRTLPSIDEPLPQLGRALFFSKSLGGDLDSACVTCHHPFLGGADQLALPVGVSAVDPDLLGPGREHTSTIPNVPRNSPTVFNTGLWDAGLFWDSRVESFGKEAFANGAVSGIRTPDTAFGVADTDAGANLATAQARFPVTSNEEMRGDTFESGQNNAAVRNHLAARIGGYGIGAGELGTTTWLTLFQDALGLDGDAESLITFENIALAIGEYERSMVFVDNPFSAYIAGDNDALTTEQKNGAILFYTDVDEGGGGCANCHSGDRFTDELHHVIAFPQIGHGKGDGLDDDFGRERETGDDADRYRFRTPSLLNVVVTAPYGHAGAYATLDEVLDHYNNPGNTVDNFFASGGVCQLDQFAVIGDCDELYPNAEANTQLALDKLAQERQDGESLFLAPDLNGDERDAIVAFLESLTDPCVLERACLSPWVADPEADPDGHQLDAIDAGGDLL